MDMNTHTYIHSHARTHTHMYTHTHTPGMLVNPSCCNVRNEYSAQNNTNLLSYRMISHPQMTIFIVDAGRTPGSSR